MASQHGSRFDFPVYNQNFSPNNFNVNPGMNRPPRPQFQRPPNPPNGSLQSPERFVHGYQNRPQFSNFSGACGFLNRPPPLHSPSTAHPPPLAPSSAAHPPPLPVCNPFSSQSNSHPSFRCALNSHSPFPGNSNLSPFPGSSTSPAFPGSSNPPFPGSSNPPPFPGSTNPPPFPGSTNSPSFSSFSGASNSSSSFPSASNSHSCFSSVSNSAFPQQHHAPSHPSFSIRPSMPPPLSHHSPVPSHKPPPLSHTPFSAQRPFSPHQPPPQHSQLPNIPHQPQHNQFLPISHPPNQHQRFHLNSPSSASRPRFDSSFQRQHRSWNQTTRFSGPRTPFSNRSPNVVKPNQFKDTSQQYNKKKREKSREFRKLKDDSTEKPYYCDTCDRAFVMENELSEHISQHIKCDYETCTFEAHPKIVFLHKKMQHETGYAERISKLQDDAEVRKWREERRKRFPTAENIRKRQAEQAEKVARGEILETKDFGKFKRRGEGSQDLAHNDGYSHRKRTRGYRGGHRGKRNHFRRNFHEPGFQQFKVDSESDSDSDSHISLNMFSGLSSLSNSAEEEMCHANETVETSSSEQNLAKSLSNVDENHLNLSHSENNSTDRKFELAVLSNAEKSRGQKRTADESILEIPEDKIDTPKRSLIVIEDSDDDGPEIMTINKCVEEVNHTEKKETESDINDVTKVSKLNHEEANGDSDDVDPEVTAISNCMEEVNQNSDGEISEVMANNKCLEEVDQNSDGEISEVMANNKCLEEVDQTERKETESDINDVTKVSKMNHEEASRGKKRTADESILEIPEDETDRPKKPLIVIEGSDDEGPEVVAVSKCEPEICIFETKEKETKLDINASAKVSTMNHEEASREEKHTRSTVSDETKVSVMNCEDASKNNQSRRHRSRRENNPSAKQHAVKKIQKSSLLEKLLADDIRHERNVILQCVRHIVNNNFFGLAVKKP